MPKAKYKNSNLYITEEFPARTINDKSIILGSTQRKTQATEVRLHSSDIFVTVPKAVLNFTSNKHSFSSNKGNPITALKGAEREAIKTHGAKPSLLKSVNKEETNNIANTEYSKALNDKTRDITGDAVRKHMASKRTERREVLKQKRDEEHQKEILKNEKLKELDKKCKDTIKSSKRDLQSLKETPGVPVFNKEPKIVISKAFDPQSTCSKEISDFSVQVEPSKTDVETQCSVVHSNCSRASEYSRHALKGHSSPTANPLKSSFKPRELMATDEIKERHKKIKTYIDKVDYVGDGDNFAEILRKIVQKCDEQMLSSSTTLESSVSDMRFPKKSNDEISQGSVGDTETSSSCFNLIPPSKKERISKLNLTAKKLSEGLKTEELLNKRLQSLVQSNGTQHIPSTINQNLESSGSRPISSLQQSELSVDEIREKMTALCLQTKVEDFNRSLPKDNTLKYKTKINFEEQYLTKPPLNFYSMEPTKLKAPPIPILTLKSNSGMPVKSAGMKSTPYYTKLYNPNEQNAAITIQAHFRGYKVRKVTSCLLKQRARNSLMKSRNTLVPKLSTYNVPSTVVPPSNKNTYIPSSHYNTAFNHEKCSSDNKEFFSLDQFKTRNQMHTNKFSLYNNSSTNKDSRSIATYSQNTPHYLHKDLPDFVKPFVALTETGDIDAFVNSYPCHKQVEKFEELKNKRSGKGFDLSVKKSPLREVSHIALLEKETQTNSMDLKQFKSRFNNDSKNFSLSEGPLSDVSNMSVEKVDEYEHLQKSKVKNVSVPKLLKIPTKDISDSAIENYKGIGKSGSAFRDYENKRFMPCPSNVLSYVEIKSNQPADDLTLSESPVEYNEISQSFVSDSSSDSHSIYKLPVSKLGSRISAELLYQDTLSSALDHLRELENIKIITQADAESAKLNNTLMEYELKNTELNNELEHERKQHREFEKKIQCSDKLLDRKVQFNIERLEREAQDRISKLEQECKSKAEAAFQLVVRTPPRNDPEIIAAAVSASISALSHPKSNFDKQSLKDKPTSLKNTSIQQESYSDDFSRSSAISNSASAEIISRLNESLLEESAGIQNVEEDSSISASHEIRTSDNVTARSECTDHSRISSDIVGESLAKTSSSVEADVSDILINSCSKKAESSSAIHSETKTVSNPQSYNIDTDIQVSEDIGEKFKSSYSSPEITESIKEIEVHSNESLDNSQFCEKVPESNISASYSESFEPDSASSDVSEASSCIVQLMKQTTVNEVSDQLPQYSRESKKTNLYINGKSNASLQSQSESPKSAKGALFSTLTLLESLQKEEEIRFNYQKALLKMQEKKLISEARQKLDAIQLEGGSNVRKKQRAVLLQLREQKSHIHRFIETQMLAAQQRQLIFLQHKDLLSSTTNASGLHSSRGPSPGFSHLLDLNLSSSEGQDTANNASPFKSIIKSSSDLSEEESACGNREERKIKTLREDTRKSISPILRDRDSRLNKGDDKIWRRKDLFPKQSSITKSKTLNKSEPPASNTSVTDNFTSDEENLAAAKSKSETLKEKIISPTSKTSGTIISLGKEIDNNFIALNEIENNDSVVSVTRDLTHAAIAISSQEDFGALGISSVATTPASKTGINDFVLKCGTNMNNKANSDSDMIISNRYSSRYSSYVGKENKASGIPFNLKFPLSPRAQLKQQRRQSSESDDSFTLSQNETASDLSDGGEGKLVALREELALRKVEAEKLQKEKRKIRRERLASQEQSLRKQIQAYESYIKEAKMEIEKESRELQHVSVKPLIKKPQVSEAVSKKLERLDNSQLDKHRVSEESASIDESLVDKSMQSNNSYNATDMDHSHTSSASSSKKSCSTEDSYSSTSIVESQNVSQLDKSISENTILSENDSELKISSDIEKTMSDNISDNKQKKISYEVLSNKEDIVNKDLVDSVGERKIEFDSEIKQSSSPKSLIMSFNDSQEIETPKSQSETSVSQGSELSAFQVSSTETIMQSPKKSKSLEKEVEIDENKPSVELIKKLHVSIPYHEKVHKKNEVSELPVLSDTIMQDKKIDIFIPSYDDKVQSKDADDETITEEIVEELPDDINSFVVEEHTVIDREIDFETRVESPDQQKKSKAIEEKSYQDAPTQLKSSELDEKANEIADSIMKNFIANSVELMLSLLSNKEKEVGEILGKIQESGDVELTSENNIHDFSSKDVCGVIGPHTFPMSPIVSRSTENILNLNSVVSRSNSLEGRPVVSLGNSLISKRTGNNFKTENCEEIKSPLCSPEGDSKDVGVDPGELTSRLLSVQASLNSPELTVDEEPNGKEKFSVSSSNGNWPDNEWWISGEKFDVQLELQEEEEKLNAEIALLEELQLFKKMHPNLVIREVPNKPPPPYIPPKQEDEKERPVISPITPPITPLPAVAKIKSTEIRPSGSKVLPQPQSPSNTISVPHRLSKADLRKLAAELFNVVPTKEEDILHVIKSFVDLLYKEWQSGINPRTVENPSEREEKEISPQNCELDKEDDIDSLEVSSQSFQHLLFDLTKELVSEIYVLHKSPPTPVWMNVSLPHPAKPWQVVKCLTKENLLSYVMSKVRVLMGWEFPTKRESTMVKWARKKRDLVDQILVHELQSEELSWTKYDEEEVEVKNELAQEIMDTLIEDTTLLFQKIIESKISNSLVCE